MLVKKICLINGLLLSANLLMAETNFFWSLDAGLLISSSQTDSGIISGHLILNNGTSYKADQEGLLGYGGIFSLHSGVGVNNIFIETGIDFCLGNRNETVITLLDHNIENAKFQRYYAYSSLDIPILVSMPLKLSDKFTIRPAAGLYISIPLGNMEYHQEAKVFTDPTFTESYNITSVILCGFESDVKFICAIEKINGGVFFKCNFKYDLNPLHGVTDDYVPFTTSRQALSFSIGYEGVF
ncbi:MAG: hypothetical protein LBB22_01440 [Treponema sp.]|nr:hypothetical protein [Treponema sp.]